MSRQRSGLPGTLLGLLLLAPTAPAAVAQVPPPPPQDPALGVPNPGQTPALGVPDPAPLQIPSPGVPGPGGVADIAPGVSPQVEPEVLTRGPIHEAFATPVVFNPVPPLVAPKPPPQEPVNEIPPDQKPEGADVEWIPGYWAWDENRNDYIWVSGVWRDIPPGRQWIPGYWSQADNGFRWTPGFWAPADASGPLDYLPAPPESQEAGPTSPAPGENYTWAPGSWVWQVDQYQWRPGYWYQAQPDWIWTPASYQATPSGYVYNDGYWDYGLDRRGSAFAPIAFNTGAINGPLSFSPNYLLPTAGLLANLFVRPSFGHYYFGDYYGASGLGGNANYVPWFGFQGNRVGYDPFYTTMAALNSRQPGWGQNFRNDYNYRLAHAEARPVANFAAQRALLNQRQILGPQAHNLGLIQPLRQYAGTPGLARPFQPVAADHRVELQRRQADMARFRDLRVRQEEQGRVAVAQRNVQAERSREALFRNEMPRSPIAAANGPRPGGRGPVALPNRPEGHAPFRPNFGPQHAAIPTVSHQRPEEFRRPGPPHGGGRGPERPRR